MCRDAERDDRELEKREDIVAMLGRRGDNDKLRKAENGRGRVAFGEMPEMTDRHRERERRGEDVCLPPQLRPNSKHEYNILT